MEIVLDVQNMKGAISLNIFKKQYWETNDEKIILAQEIAELIDVEKTKWKEKKTGYANDILKLIQNVFLLPDIWIATLLFSQTTNPWTEIMVKFLTTNYFLVAFSHKHYLHLKQRW